MSFNISNGLELLLHSNGNLVLSKEEYQVLKHTGIYTKKVSLDSLDNNKLIVIVNVYFPDECAEDFKLDNNGNYIVPDDSIGSPFLELSDEDEDDIEDWE